MSTSSDVFESLIRKTLPLCSYLSFFFNDTATTEIYTLSLHDALPIYRSSVKSSRKWSNRSWSSRNRSRDRKSTRLNSSHGYISYAVFCLKNKKNNRNLRTYQQILDRNSSQHIVKCK